ncbi:MAG: GNAT family protein [Candidatus Eremiobacterota bacterium]
MLRLFRRDPRTVVSPDGRVTLVPLQQAHIVLIRQWLTDPDVTRLAFGTQASGAALDQLVRDYCKEIRLGRKNSMAIEIGPNRCVGFVRYSLRNSSRGRMARVGILIGNRIYWNSGLGSESMLALLHYLFDSGVDVVELDTADFNQRAHRCFEKAGFLVVGEQVQLDGSGGEPCNKIWMEVTRERWIQLGSRRAR